MGRRRLMMGESGERTVKWYDVTLTAENTIIDAAVFTTAFVNEYSTNKPKKITMSLYPVTPTSGTVTQNVGFYVWNTGGYADKSFPAYNTNGRSTRFSDGSTVCAKAELTQSSSNNYDVVTSSNNAANYTASIVFNPTTSKRFRARTNTKFGVGSRLVVTATY